MISAMNKLLCRQILRLVQRNIETSQNIVEKAKVKQDFPLYVRHDDHYKICKTDTVNKISELLDLNKATALELVTKYEKTFIMMPAYSICENYYSCITYGLTKKMLIDNPRLLATNYIRLKLEYLKSLPYDLDVTVSLLILDRKLIQKLVKIELVESKIPKLALLFEVPEKTICQWYSDKQFLVTAEFEMIETVYKLLIASGVTKSEIINDLSVLRYSVEQIQRRIDFAKENNIEKFKTWMVRAPYLVMETYLRRKSDTKSILGDNSLIQYLSERLQCTESWVKFIIEKHPALQRKSLRKLNEMIDFLMICGFTQVHICRSPKILLHRVETVKKRLKELDDCGKKLESLHILTKSKKQFNQFCELVKANKTKK